MIGRGTIPLEELDSLVAARLGIEEDDEGTAVGDWQRFHYKIPKHFTIKAQPNLYLSAIFKSPSVGSPF
jgi:hypothetical protein